MNYSSQRTIPHPRTNSKTLLILSRIGSFIFHPKLVPITMTFVLARLSPASFAGINSRLFNKWLLIIGLYTLIFPLISIALLKAFRVISSMRMHDAKDRIIPLFSVSIFYFLAVFYFLHNSNTPLLLMVLLTGTMLTVIVIFLINIFYKISVHTAASGNVLGIIIAFTMSIGKEMVLLYLLALIAGCIVATARYLLGAHTIGQIVSGYALGILLQVLAYIYLNSL